MQDGFGPTKNPQSVRKIKINKKVMKMFADWFNKTPQNFLALVFYSPASKYKVLSNTSAGKVLKKLCDDLNIQVISPHGLRHTKASVMLYRGISIYYVSEYLGHADIETTMRDYSHIIKELRKKDEELMLKELV
jgi:integrase